MAPYIDLAALVSAPDVLSTVPQEPDRVFVVYSKIEKLAKNANKPVGYFNRTTWKAQAEPAVPLLFLERERWDRNQLPVFVKEGEWVELVLNNLDEGGHPFHLVFLHRTPRSSFCQANYFSMANRFTSSPSTNPPWAGARTTLSILPPSIRRPHLPHPSPTPPRPMRCRHSTCRAAWRTIPSTSQPADTPCCGSGRKGGYGCCIVTSCGITGAG